MLLSKHPFLSVKLDLQTHGICREIALRFFSREEIMLYLTQLFPGNQFPLEFQTFIDEKTEGNPLFVADLIQYLLDRRVIEEKQGEWILTAAIPEIGRELPELCLQVEESPQMFSVLRGLSLFYNNRSQLATARELGEQLLRLTEDQPEQPLFWEALFSLGITHFLLGDFVSTLNYMKRAISRENLESQQARITLYEQNPTDGCLAVASLALWALGFPDQALQKSNEAVAFARQLAQPFNLARTFAWAALPHLFRGEWWLAQE